jgi:hypothetical protein
MIHSVVYIGWVLELAFHWEEDGQSRRPKWDGAEEHPQPVGILCCRSARHWTGTEETGLVAAPGDSKASIDTPWRRQPVLMDRSVFWRIRRCPSSNSYSVAGGRNFAKVSMTTERSLREALRGGGC